MLDIPVTGRLILKPKRSQPLLARHPWVFPGAIDRLEGEPSDGDAVDVIGSAGQFVARGLFNSQSKLRARLYSWDESVPIDEELFARRIDDALTLRHDLLGFQPDARAGYRAIFSEADRLSGMVVDYYAGWLTVQFTALALARRREELARLLMEKLDARGVYLRTEKGVGLLEGIELQDGLLLGEPPPADLTIHEHGLDFLVNLAEGQKTGYYLDQRDNRQAAAKLCTGRRVLDTFCYTGGFALHAAKAGATEVLALDVSEPALSLARRNAERNELRQVRFEKADVLNRLGQLAASGEKFDVVILDPPKFARNRSAVPRAMQGYRKLHQQALRLLNPNGILVSCCCTGLISLDDLQELIAQVAGSAGRDLQFLEVRGASADHPTSASCRETRYLKCVMSRVS